MPTIVQFRRGTTAQNNNFTGAAGELSIDTTLNVLRIHDGSTVGGFSQVTETATQTLTNKTYSGVSLSVTGNISGGNLNVTGNIVDTGAIAVITGASGNVTLAPNGTNVVIATTTGANITGTLNATGNANVGNLGTAGLITATGNITGGNLSVSTGTITGGNIVNSNANGVGNIGTSTVYFNTVFAKATSAQYADVAELYSADADYPVGTVLVFGGEQEVTQSTNTHDTAIAGTVSDKPAYVMNTGLKSNHIATVALLGRVPCRVKGNINKGDLLVSSDQPGVATSCDTTKYQPGCVIGKSLGEHRGDTEGTVEVVVGRL